MVTYDYIITGIGCAGLSLIYYILESSLKDKNILLIDNSSKIENDRTWCYWADNPLEIHPKQTPLIFWDKITVTESKKSISSHLQNLKYFHIKSSDFYKEVIEKIKKYPNISFIKDRVENIYSLQDGTVEVSTAGSGKFKTELVFNSIPFSHSETKVLRQVFVGWKVSTKSQHFDPSSMTMMHFVSDQKDKTDFFYILPFNEYEALVEYTIFSNGNVDMALMEQNLSGYLLKHFGISEYNITHRESGSIPMTTLETPANTSSNIIHIGTLAGCSKPSTGYTFYDIQKHCKAIVHELQYDKKVNSRIWNRKRRFKFYDNIILNIAIKWPAALPSIFNDMFSRNKANLVLKFLQEETSLWEEISILSRLQFSIFIKSLINYEKH
jgi:lycopene beta-cyclase